ncbi:MAG: bile acid:sodium symporter family protein [Deltaproteobacteria bacterium]|nr:bile acid:sodium symporter family protein [Deltaproteobacteria bacterium]MCW5802454.1 bile acid:sodium symporter family protein [Deltaproteobacteria bacterium]
MEQSVITTVLLPVALGVIMLGLGLSLAIADFQRIVQYPKAAAVGLGCQMLVLPFACLGIAHAFDLPPPLAVGLMLLAASPGGATANLFSHLAKGDVALNITLTAVNSVLSLATLPIIVNLSLEHFLGEGQAIPLQFSKIIQVVLLVLIPVAIGMTIRSKRRDIADRLERPVKLISALFLALVVVSAIVKERDNLADSFRAVGLAALAFNLASMFVGYVVPLVFRVERRQAIAIGMEIGIHNGTLAIAIASSPSLLNNPAMAIPAAIYSLIMFFTAAAFGMWISRRA